MKAKLGSVFLIFVFCLGGMAQACVWDAKTLAEEQHEHPTLAEAILSPKTETPDIAGLKKHLRELQAKPRTNDPAWWNDFAGTHLRLGQPAEAVKILAPLTKRFANDYGVHANLGTAYHLLGRYREAEREIRQDTEINTNAHFGLEKYHLALLQYLSRDKSYRLRHVYVDEFSIPFALGNPILFMPQHDYEGDSYLMQKMNSAELKDMEKKVNKFLLGPPSSEQDYLFTDELLRLIIHDARPGYIANWNLATDPKLEEGVIYMATLNSQEPACWLMLGALAEHRKDYNLSKSAYERALQLGSPQKALIRRQLRRLQVQLDERVEHEKLTAEPKLDQPLPAQ